MKRNLFVAFLILVLTACGSPAEAELEKIIPAPPVVFTEFPDSPEDIVTATLPPPEEPLPAPEQDIPAFNDYVVTLEFEPETRIINGIESVRYTNRTGVTLNHVAFRVPHHEHMDISNVFKDNEELLFILESSVLIIDLLRPLLPDETIQIHIHFEAYIPAVAHRTGANDRAVWGGAFLPVESVFGEDGWHTEPYYPVGNPFIHNVVNYSVEIITPIGYTVAGTGTKTETYLDYHKITSFNAQVTRDFAFAISPYFERRTKMSPSGLVEISLYHFSDNLPVEHILAVAAETLTFFEEAVGAYPYPHLCIVETDMFRSGERFSAMIFMDSAHLRTSQNLSTLRNAIGHQWFSVIIGNNPIEEAWLSGGLTQFLQAGLLGYPNELRTLMEREHRYLMVHLPQINDPYTRRVDTRISYYTAWLHYFRVQHRKSQLMFYSLYREMGEERFVELLREYYRRFAFQMASSEDFIALAEEIHGESLQSFFVYWLNTTELPDLPAR